MTEAQIHPNKHPASESGGREGEHRAVLPQDHAGPFTRERRCTGSHLRWLLKTGMRGLSRLLPAPPWRDRCLHQPTFIYTIYRKTRFKESIFKKTISQRTTFPVVWETSPRAISRVKLQFYHNSHKERYFLEAQKAMWTPHDLCTHLGPTLLVPGTNLSLLSSLLQSPSVRDSNQ